MRREAGSGVGGREARRELGSGRAASLTKMVQRIVLPIETFWDEPTARYSKRWPPYGKGEVRLRSSVGMRTFGHAGMPRLIVFVASLLQHHPSFSHPLLVMDLAGRATRDGSRLAPGP